MAPKPSKAAAPATSSSTKDPAPKPLTTGFNTNILMKAASAVFIYNPLDRIRDHPCFSLTTAATGFQTMEKKFSNSPTISSSISAMTSSHHGPAILVNPPLVRSYSTDDTILFSSTHKEKLASENQVFSLSFLIHRSQVISENLIFIVKPT